MKKYENFVLSLSALERGVACPAPNELEKMGIILAFNNCFEQSWKLMKEVLEDHGRIEERIGTPRAIIKIAWQCGMLSDAEGWLKLMKCRNRIAHTYDGDYSLEVLEEVRDSHIHLFRDLKKELDANWL